MTVLRNTAFQIGAAAVLGLAFGLIVGEWATNLQFVGDIFIRLIQMSIVPLVMASVIYATGSMSGTGTGKVAGRTFGWILGFSLISAVVAYLLSILIRPGESLDFVPGGDDFSEEAGTASESAGWQDTLLNFVTTNIFDAMSTATMVPIIVFSLLFGVALRMVINETGNDGVLTLVDQIQRVVLTMIRLVMKIAPVGVFCLLAPLAGDVGWAVVTSTLKYLGANLLGVVLLLLLFTLITAAVTRLNPLLLPAKLADQTAIAVTTTSSAVTFPTVLRTAIEKVGVSQRIANFTLSVGLTMGSCGAVLNYMIVIMFLAQSGDMQLSFGQIILGMGLAILLNLGTITVPGGFPVIVMFLGASLELPLEAVGLLIAVDWFAGIFRTFLNVNGDTLVSMLVANASDDIDRDVYNGRKSIVADTGDGGDPEQDDELREAFARADRMD